MKTVDVVEVKTKKGKYRGILLPSSSKNNRTLVLKLSSGYNIGILKKNIISIRKIASHKAKSFHKKRKILSDSSKKTISILHCGGTIASKIDYETGAVTPLFSPQEIISLFPELEKLANIKTRRVTNIFSENVRFKHYELFATEIAKEIKKGVDGIIVTHGTDTLGYTAAALAFQLQNLPVPVILVGAQRSSDRPSTDARFNLISAVRFAANSDFAGVAVCMHGSPSDTFCLVHPPCKVRKMHTSRRDAFVTVNDKPIAKIDKNGKIFFYKKKYLRKDKKRKLKLFGGFEENVIFLKIYPNMSPKIFDFIIKNKFKGVVFEATGLGHMPIQKVDEYSAPNQRIFSKLKKYVKSGGIVVFAPQALFGRLNMNVYSTGRKLSDVGVISAGDMLPETAFIKLAWILKRVNKKDEVERLMNTNYAGELNSRSKLELFKVII